MSDLSGFEILMKAKVLAESFADDLNKKRFKTISSKQIENALEHGVNMSTNEVGRHYIFGVPVRTPEVERKAYKLRTT